MALPAPRGTSGTRCADAQCASDARSSRSCGTHTAAGQDPEDPGALGVGGTRAMVGSVEAPDRRGRQHAEKVTILFPYVGHPARAADPHRRGPPARPRVGRVGRPAAAQQRELRLRPDAVLRLVRDRARWSGSASPRSPSISSLPGSPISTPRSPGCSGSALAVVGVVLWLWWGVLFLSYAHRPRAAARAPGRARAVPPAHAAHLARGGPVRPPRLGGERVGQGLQRAGPAARAEGRARASCCC